MNDKPIVKYIDIPFPLRTSPVGQSVVLICENQPEGTARVTSTVMAYDEEMGIFETRNTVYIPA